MDETDIPDEWQGGGERDWFVAKSLLDAMDRSVAALELHARYGMYHDDPPDGPELRRHLEQARRHHERALADVEAAIAVLDGD